MPEWNTKVDPEAADIVYKLCPEKNRFVGLNVTAQVYMEGELAKERLSKYLPNIVSDMLEVWLGEREFVTFHDPLAAALIFKTKICEFKKSSVTINLKNRPGITEVTDLDTLKHNIATTVNSDLFLNEFFTILNKDSVL